MGVLSAIFCGKITKPLITITCYLLIATLALLGMIYTTGEFAWWDLLNFLIIIVLFVQLIYCGIKQGFSGTKNCISVDTVSID